MDRTSYDRWNCPTQNAVELIGDKWSLFIIREFIFGKTEMRFNEMLKLLKPISSRTLALKLKKLEKNKILDRIVIDKNHLKVNYKITRKGLMLKKSLVDLAQWHKAFKN